MQSDKLRSIGIMMAKAAAGAILAVLATQLSSVDLGAGGNAIAIVVAQVAVHLLDKYKLRPES